MGGQGGEAICGWSEGEVVSCEWEGKEERPSVDGSDGGQGVNCDGEWQWVSCVCEGRAH